MRIGRWIAVTTLALAGAMPVLAHGGPGREQFQAVVSSAFTQADVDGNGALSPEEFANFHTILRTEMAKARFARADANGDGQVTLEELQAARPPHHCGPHGPDGGTDQK